MKIAITGNSFPMSKDMAYGGERVVFGLIQELCKLGHEIHVFAKEGSNFNGINIAGYYPVTPVDGRDAHFETAVATGHDFGVYMCSYFGENWTEETQERWPYVELTWCRWCHAAWQLNKKPYNVVSYSKVLQQDFMETGIKTTMIHYGLPKDLYQLSMEHDGYAVWIGKIEGGKAPEMGIKLAKAAGLKLVVMGPPYNTGVLWSQVMPYVDNENVFWVRGVDDAMKQKIMSRAKVLIYTNDNSWKEHYGLIMIEAHAMGVPVVGMNRIGQDCSVRVDNIIQDGRNGFILDYKDSNQPEPIIEDGVKLLARISEIDRAECRKSFEERFTAELMARRYEWLYEQVAAGARFDTVEIPI